MSTIQRASSPRDIYAKLYEIMSANCDLLFVVGQLRPDDGEELGGMAAMCMDMQVRLKRLADAEGRIAVVGGVH